MLVYKLFDMVCHCSVSIAYYSSSLHPTEVHFFRLIKDTLVPKSSLVILLHIYEMLKLNLAEKGIRSGHYISSYEVKLIFPSQE